MKPYCAVILVGALLVSQSALAAAEQVEEVAPDSRVLGTTEAILAYCGKVDPAGAEHFAEQGRQLAHGASAEALDKTRKSDEYREAHDAMIDTLGKIEVSTAVKVCAQYLPQVP